MSKKIDHKFQSGISSIYKNQDGTLPDISHLDVQRTGRWKIITFTFLFILAIIAGIAWLWYVLVNIGGPVSSQSIELEIISSQNVASGDEVEYQIKYTNVDKVTLQNVEIIARYPRGFEFVSSSPESSNSFNSAWSLGALEAGQAGTIVIKGRLIGEVGSLKKIDATISFQPENFSSVFKETASFSSQINSSIVQVEIIGPEQILSDEEVTYLLRYKNTSDRDLQNIQIKAEYPANFVFKESFPEAFFEEGAARNFNNTWYVNSLGKGQEGEIEVVGSYTYDENNQEINFIAQIGFTDEDTGQLSLQQEVSSLTKVIGQNLLLNLIINGSSQDQPINFNQKLTYSIVYKNLGREDIDDLEITAELLSDVLNWDTLEDKHGGKVIANKIVWDKDSIAALDLVRPLDEGTIDFTINTISSDATGSGDINLTTTSTISASMATIGELEAKNITIEANEINNNINTDVTLSVQGRYFDDNNIAVGTGPLPPRVGEETSFRIYWSVANSLHAIEDVLVSAILPSGVNWDEKTLVSAGELSFDEETNTVSWTLARVSANQTSEDVNVWFDVSVVPTKEQAKRLIILTDQTTLEATDSVTDIKITKNSRAITSNLDDDPNASGKGLVIDTSE